MTPLWPFAKSERRGGSPSPEEEGPKPVEFHSRALELLVERFGSRPRWRVLDLGPASNENLHFFVAKGATYVVEDLWATAAPCRSVGDVSPDCLEKLEGLFDFPADRTFDLVLAWDLFDYLGPDALPVIARRLVPFCAPGTLLYTIVSRERRLPARPRRCTAVADDRVRLGLPAPAAREAPGLTDPALARLLSPFRVEKSFLLKIHAQEYIFELGRKEEGGEERHEG